MSQPWGCAFNSLEESGLLIKSVSETIKNKGREQKDRFLGILISTLGVTLSGNLLTGKGVITDSEEVIRAGQDF